MAKDFGSSEGWVNAEDIFFRGKQTAEREYKYFETAFMHLFGLQVLGSKCCRCWSNSGSDQVEIGTYDRKSYLPAKLYMAHTKAVLVWRQMYFYE
jgi:hypothetical protein